jgi:predicted anti-sigma-YlaC factor YlaD
MSEHDRIVKLLPLAASGDVTAEEIRRIREHLTDCAACRGASGDYALLGSALRGLPTPQPGAELLARVQALAAPRLVQKRARSRDAWVLAPLVAASWVAALTTFPWVYGAGRWLFAGWHLPGGSFMQALAVYSILGYLLASAAAIAVGRHTNAIGRLR